jgi:hypothetical protein
VHIIDLEKLKAIFPILSEDENYEVPLAQSIRNDFIGDLKKKVNELLA